MDDGNLIENNIEDIINSLDDKKLTNDDLTSSDNLHLSKHNEEFSDLLLSYVNNYKASSSLRLISRKVMFLVSIVVMVLVTLTVIVVVIWSCAYVVNSCGDVVAVVPTVVGAVVSLVSVFMVIPQIIANYLYNAEEEKYLSEIIGKIQEYDSRIREQK